MALRRFLSRLGRRPPPHSAPGDSSGAALLDLPTADLPYLQALQRRGSVHPRPGTATWLVVGHAALRQVLADPLLYSSRPQAAIEARLLGAGPPGHGEVRRRLAPLFAAEATTPLLSDFQARAASLVRPEFDIVADFAAPLTGFLGARLIGVDEATFAGILRDVEAARLGGTAGGGTAAGVGAAAPALRGAALCRRLLREAPGELSEAEAISLVGLLATASTETTERLIVRCALILLRVPDLRAGLAARPERLPDLVEEAMRLFPPEPTLLREATAPAELDGVAIPRGAELRLSAAAANRDPACFERPDALDLDRRERGHFAFGGGIHQCIGAGVARRAVARAVETLLLADPPLRLAQPPATLAVADVGGRLLPRALPVASDGD